MTVKTSKNPAAPDADTVMRAFRRARENRQQWESLWQDAYDHALPQRAAFTAAPRPGAARTDRLFDGTAPDAVDQLAASLLAQLTPPWSRWFGLALGPDVNEEERAEIGDTLDAVTETVQTHLDRSNFVVEAHQAYLDLVTGGTASLLLEEAEPGEASAFRFTAVPLSDLYVEEGATGRLETTFRRTSLTGAALRERFPKASLPANLSRRLKDDPELQIPVLEAVLPHTNRYAYLALLEGETRKGGKPVVLKEGAFEENPFLNFRWLKAPGESYGRSPVMKALPDIKTANKVVELILKNASIAVTGIWMADDDGVLNPANIELVPGTIIPKAVGSQGLTPLQPAGEFELSQLVLEDLRARIRHALLADRLGQIRDPKMTATEVMERSAEMARLLGATFGRLQVEFLTPLVDRAMAILRRRKEIPDIRVDGRTIELVYRSPLAQEQAKKDVANVQAWLQSVAGLGPQGMAAVDINATARWFGRTLGVPEELIKKADDQADPANPLAALTGAAADPAQLDGILQALTGGEAGGLEGAAQSALGALGSSPPADAAPPAPTLAQSLGLPDAGSKEQTMTKGARRHG